MADYDVIVDQGAAELLEAFADRDDDSEQRAIEKSTALQALAFVLGKNFAAAEATEKDGVFSLNFRVVWNRAEEPTLVKAVARCSRVSTSDIELNCRTNE